MTIGLILLAVVAILIFFGVTEGFFRKIGIRNWLAFILVLALVIGAIVPRVEISFFSMNIGGFLIPLAIMVVFLVVMKSGAEALRSFIAMIAVAAAAVTTRMLIEPVNAGLILSSSLIIGFVGGAVAYLASRTRTGALAAVLGGILIGDIIVNLINILAFSATAFTLGSYGVFDSLIIGLCFAMILTESINAVKRVGSHRRIARHALSMEAARDEKIDGAKSSEEKECTKNDCPPDYDGFFDEFI